MGNIEILAEHRIVWQAHRDVAPNGCHTRLLAPRRHFPICKGSARRVGSEHGEDKIGPQGQRLALWLAL
jgi:hypothetical protein